MRVTAILGALLTITACRTPATEQTAAAPPAAPVKLMSPGLMPGMGNHHHAIATSSPEAQRFFDQDMSLVFGFNHEEAVRSFTRAAELDPKAAMPHWGTAWAFHITFTRSRRRRRRAAR